MVATLKAATPMNANMRGRGQDKLRARRRRYLISILQFLGYGNASVLEHGDLDLSLDVSGPGVDLGF